MPSRSYALCSTYVLTLLCAVHAGRDPSSAAVTLASGSNQYVVGQPVELIVTVKNVGQQGVQAWVGARKDQIEVYVAREGNDFHRYTRGEYDHGDSERSVERLRPAKSKVYTLRILYTFYEKETAERRCRLAFDQPGLWLVKVRYPLYPNRQVLESNTIRINIKEPEGADARVWQQINTRALLYFLQWGLVHDDHGYVVPKAVEVLHAIPTSSYHPALRWALLEYYRHETYGGLRDVEPAKLSLLEEIRKLLRLPDPQRQPFPEDKRLDAEVTYRFDDWMPLEKAFQEMSRISGVTLRLAPELRLRRISGGTTQTKTLRRFMDQHDEYKAQWVRDGDGYRLVPVAPPEKEKVTGTKLGRIGDQELRDQEN